ncbi:hypothetical protein Pcinc_018321 [Petrolisthes cinctipes]|uniref:Uncharacterized protein n=1 Tax=Petrolisthes cinctipes TaxID=88211 RepID=A0AAE1KNX1_PETCI|nr:hypothetical protein Pcinc_018321 [Petrolisthes cinctipes]
MVGIRRKDGMASAVYFSLVVWELHRWVSNLRGWVWCEGLRLWRGGAQERKGEEGRETAAVVRVNKVFAEGEVR